MPGEALELDPVAGRERVAGHIGLVEQHVGVEVEEVGGPAAGVRSSAC